jgi:hypothetical protein
MHEKKGPKLRSDAKSADESTFFEKKVGDEKVRHFLFPITITALPF